MAPTLPPAPGPPAPAGLQPGLSAGARCGRSGFAATVVGAGGNIGSSLMSHLVRLPGLRLLRLIDPDSYEPRNLRDQNIDRVDVGHAKVRAIARRLARIDPDLPVDSIATRVQDVPMGKLRTDVVLTCLDSRGARRYVNRVVRRLGVAWWIDAGIEPADLLVRVNVYRSDPGAPCYECGWSAADYATLERIHPCAGDDDAGPAPTGAPSGLGGLAAALVAIELQKIVTGQAGRAAVDKQVTMSALHHIHNVSAFRADPDCRCPHDAWSIERLDEGPEELTVGRVLDGGGSLRVEGKGFVRTTACVSCGHLRSLLRLEGRLGRWQRACPQCGGRMTPVGFDQLDHLHPEQLSPPDLERSLASLGFEPGDIFSIQRNDGKVHHELA